MRCTAVKSFYGVTVAIGALLLGAVWVFAQSQTGTATIEFTHPRFVAMPHAQVANISLRRTGNTNTAVSVDFTTADDTAIAGTHYGAKTGPINFAPGQTEENVALPILDGPRADESKTVRLTLSNPRDGAVLGPRGTAELVLPRIRNTAWLNFGLDRIGPLREPLFDIPIWQYLASLLYIFLAFYISKLLDFLIRGKLRQWARTTHTSLDDLLLELLRGPIKVIAFVIFLHIGLRVFAWPEWLAEFISKGLRIVVAVSLTYMALRFVDLVTGYWKQRIRSHEDRPFSDQLLPIIRNSLKVFTVVVAVPISATRRISANFAWLLKLTATPRDGSGRIGRNELVGPSHKERDMSVCGVRQC